MHVRALPNMKADVKREKMPKIKWKVPKLTVYFNTSLEEDTDADHGKDKSYANSSWIQ